MNRVFHEQVDELEVELFDTGALRTKEETNVPTVSTFVPPNLETRLVSVPAVPQGLQSSSKQEQKSDVLDRLGEAPARRTIQSRRRLRLGPFNQTKIREMPMKIREMPMKKVLRVLDLQKNNQIKKRASQES